MLNNHRFMHGWDKHLLLLFSHPLVKTIQNELSLEIQWLFPLIKH